MLKTYFFIFSGAANGKDSQDLWEELEETPIEVDEFDSLFSRPQVKAACSESHGMEFTYFTIFFR